jgi:hypothetical protein
MLCFLGVLSVQQTDRAGNGPEVRGTEVTAATGRVGIKQNARTRLGSRAAASRKALPQEILHLNGTAVPEGFTIGPFSITFDGYSFGGAGGWALNER